MLLSAVSVLVVAQSSSEIPEGLMNNPVLGITVQNLVGRANWRLEFVQPGFGRMIHINGRDLERNSHSHHELFFFPRHFQGMTKENK